MSKSSTHLVALIIQNSKKQGASLVCKELCECDSKTFDVNKFVKDKTKLAYLVSQDRRNNGLDVTPVILTQRLWDEIIAEWPIDCIEFKTSKTSAGGISKEGFVAMHLKAHVNNVDTRLLFKPFWVHDYFCSRE